MTQPSKGAAAFLTLFGLPFLCGGLAFAYAHLVSRGNFDTFQLALGIMVASVFVFIGGGLLCSLPGIRALKATGCPHGSKSTLSLVVADGLGLAPGGKPK